jgi:hypothetical protein
MHFSTNGLKLRKINASILRTLILFKFKAVNNEMIVHYSQCDMKKSIYFRKIIFWTHFSIFLQLSPT